MDKDNCSEVSYNREDYNSSSKYDLGFGIVQHKYSDGFVAPMAIILIIVSIASVVGNGLVVATIARHRGMRTRTNLLLANLAAADILVGALDMPFSLVALIKGTWVFGPGACQFNAFTTGVALMASIHTLMFISIHKYISMTRPFSRFMTPFRVSLMAFFVWLWALLYNTTPFLGLTSNVYKKGATQCGPIIPCTKPQKFHSLINTIFNFLVPLIVMTFCNVKISKAVGEHMGRMRKTSNMTYRNTVMQQKHITITLIIVMVCFLLCWTPYMIYSTTLAFINDDLDRFWNPVVYWFGYANSACNPIIYAFRSPSFRQGYLEILCRSRSNGDISNRELSRYGLNPHAVIASGPNAINQVSNVSAASLLVSGSSVKQNRTNSDKFNASGYGKRSKGRGAPWGQRFSQIPNNGQIITNNNNNNDSSLRQQMLPRTEASRNVVERLTRHTIAKQVNNRYPCKSTPDMRNNDDNEIILRRCDTDSCIAMLLSYQTAPMSETRACSFHTIAEGGSNQEIFRVIVTDADAEENQEVELKEKNETPCLRTDSAYVISIDEEQSNSDNKQRRSSSYLNSSVLPLEDIKSYATTGKSPQSNRRYTETVNSLINIPKDSAKFHSDPGGLAPKYFATNQNRSSNNEDNTEPTLNNLTPKWRLSVEALDKNQRRGGSTSNLNTGKNSGLRGSIMSFLGRGNT